MWICAEAGTQSEQTTELCGFLSRQLVVRRPI